jgi:hypothetical protein
MESGYSFVELANMHLVLGKCNENATDAVRSYKENFHNQSIPDRHFLSVARGLQEAGTFHGTPCDVGRHLLHVKYGERSRSSRSLMDSLQSVPARTGSSQDSVHRTREKQQLYPYRIQSVQEYVIPQDAQSVSGFFNSWLKPLSLQAFFRGRIIR